MNPKENVWITSRGALFAPFRTYIDKMSNKKAEIKQIVRDNLPQSMLLVEKNMEAGKSRIIPGRHAAGDSIVTEVRQAVVDLSIYAHHFTNVVASAGPGSSKIYLQKRGQELVDSLRRGVDDAFAEGYSIVVLVLDKQCHTTAAKENTQNKRAITALNDCASLRCQPVAWDLDNPTPLVVLDDILLPMCAIKAVPAAFRYMLWESMHHIMRDFTPPSGCRLIIDVQDYASTNPATPAEWLAGPQIRITEKYADVVDKAREALERMPPGQWRHAARRLSTEFGRAGAYQTLPWCIHMSPNGLRLAPYLLPKCGNTCGEADLAVWRWVQLLFADRQNESFSDACIFTQSDGLQYIPTLAEIESDRRGGRTMVATLDSDFFAGSAACIATIMCDYMHGKPADYRTLDHLGCYCPLLLMGDTFSTATGYVADSSVYGKETEARESGGRILMKVFEFVDTFRFFCCIVFDRFKVDAVAQGATMVGKQPTTLRGLDIAQTTPHQWFRRALSFVVFSICAGNDYLCGLFGMTHEPMWTAFAAMTRQPGGELAVLTRSFLRPFDTKQGELPSQAAVLVNPSAYTQFIKLCYFISLQNKGGPHAPACAPSAMSYLQLSVNVKNKYKAIDKNHMPDVRKLRLMYDRTLWCLYYILYGPNSVRRTLDETHIGWPLEDRGKLV
jgi:hypothetical protein